MFNSVRRRNVSQEFEGGKIAVVFGEVNLDLTGVSSKLAQVEIKADAVFGGINLRLPATWDVDVRGAGVFGVYQNETHRPAAPGTRCVVRGGAVFGGVRVSN